MQQPAADDAVSQHVYDHWDIPCGPPADSLGAVAKGLAERHGEGPIRSAALTDDAIDAVAPPCVHLHAQHADVAARGQEAGSRVCKEHAAAVSSSVVSVGESAWGSDASRRGGCSAACAFVCCREYLLGALKVTDT